MDSPLSPDTDDEVEDFLHRIPKKRENTAGNKAGEQAENEEQCCSDDLVLNDGCQLCHPEMNSVISERESHHNPQSDDLTATRANLGLPSNEDILVVHRPISFNATSVSFDADEQRYRLEVQDMDWYNSILERYLDAGYGPRSETLGSVDSVVGILHSLPPDLAAVLKEGLHALQVLRATQPSRSQVVAAIAANEWTGHFAAMEDDMWERNEQCGYLRFEWDPVTERRRCIPRLAQFPSPMLTRTPRQSWHISVPHAQPYLLARGWAFLS
jgi:hypothetical protein